MRRKEKNNMVDEIKKEETTITTKETTKEETVRNNNPFDDVVELTENGERAGQSLMFVAVVRHLLSPFLIVFFCFFYAALAFTGLYIAYCGKLDLKDTFVLIVGFTSNILTMMVSYRFAKGSAMDKPKV